MKKFIFKSSLFIIPFFTLYVLNLLFYDKGEGDLTRVGLLYGNPSPKSKVLSQFSTNKYYKNVTETSLDTISKFDVLTIGDSFSNQGVYGYINFLAMQDKNVLNLDKFLTDNDPIQKLIELANGDFFTKIKTKYVVLESVERLFFERCQKLDFSKSSNLEVLKRKIKSFEPRKPVKRDMKFFSNSTLKMPLTNIQYLYQRNPPYSLTYKVETTISDLFAGETNNLLFTKHDITFKNLYRNELAKLVEFNSKINQLSKLLDQKDVKLILLICPDKYDLYYPYIEDKSGLMEPFFYKTFNTLSKDYLYVNSIEILSNELKKHKDVYFYDDTHWSPIGAKAIGNGIKKLLENNDSKN